MSAAADVVARDALLAQIARHLGTFAPVHAAWVRRLWDEKPQGHAFWLRSLALLLQDLERPEEDPAACAVCQGTHVDPEDPQRLCPACFEELAREDGCE